MANIENTENLPTDSADLDTELLPIVADELDTDELEIVDPGTWAETEADLDAEWAQPAQAFRYLTWVHAQASHAWTVDLSRYSEERQAGVRDLVNHALVSERVWTGGANDGRVTLRLTPEGWARLHAARDAAALTVVA
jgi:hypothetical protein